MYIWVCLYTIAAWRVTALAGAVVAVDKRDAVDGKAQCLVRGQAG
jgi:hypothetical protein